MVRAKFKVDAISKSMSSVKNLETGKYESQPATVVTLSPVYQGSPENERFYAATPGGSMQLCMLRGEVSEQFQVGKEFYIDFTPAG